MRRPRHVGFPVALIMGMLFIMALMPSCIFVSFAVGRKIVDLFKINLKFNDLLIFVLGFVILSLLFRIPYAGVSIVVVAVSSGFGLARLFMHYVRTVRASSYLLTFFSV